LAYCFGNLYVVDLNLFQVTKKCAVNLGYKEKYFSRIKLLYRFLRLGIRSTIQINQEIIVLLANKRFYELNLQNMKLKAGFIPKSGINTLNISVLKGISGFDDMVVFGGYFSNPKKNPVHIYKRIDLDTWEIVFSFPMGKINHIHNIVPDADNSCVWIFTGDFDESAAIWQARDNFGDVECIVSFDQIYRGCVAFPLNKGVLYATDSPFAQNSIRFLYNDGNGWVSVHVANINGSCIYGCMIKNKYVFSTVVEPDGRDEDLLKLIFGWKRGNGIKDSFAYIYIGDMDDGFKEIYKAKKDKFSFIFQFGALKFPSGVNNTDYILTEHIATKKYDCSTVAILVGQEDNKKND